MRYKKQIILKGLDTVTVTPEINVTVEQMQKINSSYALSDMKPSEVYVRRFLLAHNGVDRDRERFSEECLNGFMTTLPGKSVLRGHNRNELPTGLFFDASVETMSKEQFKALTGEEINLPDPIKQAQILYGWVFFLRNNTNKDLIAAIDGGICRYVSIGFSASALVAVKGQHDETLYYEYVGPGEALEGSIVWLGAQPGAVIKGSGASKKESGANQNKEKVNPLIPKNYSEIEERGQVKSSNFLIPSENEEADEQVKRHNPLISGEDEENSNPLIPAAETED